MAVTIKSEREIQLMREAGKILAKVHEELAQEVKAGMTSYQIDKICEEIIRGYGCIPSFLGYEGYPGSVCISINDEVVHGLPSKDKIIRDGCSRHGVPHTSRQLPSAPHRYCGLPLSPARLPC